LPSDQDFIIVCVTNDLVAVGVSDHSGWAVWVSVAFRKGEPVVIDRRRVELIEPGLPSRPYEHETLDLDAQQAEALAQEVRESALHCTAKALAKLRSNLRPPAKIFAIALREPPLPCLPESVAAAHASYPVTMRADAMIYHDALSSAASTQGIGVELIARGQERQRASRALRTGVDRIDEWLLEQRVLLGPPWQKDHRDAAARAIAAFAKYTLSPKVSPSPNVDPSGNQVE
jgi:hypothetical protein